mmetsp:Transcript_20943/g.50576  ORF Transcript_20943/g.50576 Transcript_20943/m.50576 type:complete len:207 (-) Transcript_20943:1507-2127(-)
MTAPTTREWGKSTRRSRRGGWRRGLTRSRWRAMLWSKWWQASTIPPCVWYSLRSATWRRWRRERIQTITASASSGTPSAKRPPTGSSRSSWKHACRTRAAGKAPLGWSSGGSSTTTSPGQASSSTTPSSPPSPRRSSACASRTRRPTRPSSRRRPRKPPPALMSSRRCSATPSSSHASTRSWPSAWSRVRTLSSTSHKETRRNWRA